MTAKTKNRIQCVAVLAIIALCSVLLLGAFNLLTYVDPFQSTLDGFKKDSGAEGEFTMVVADEPVNYGTGQIVYYAVSDDEVPVHAFLAGGSGGYQGTVQIYVYVRDNKIYKIVIGENSETFLGKLDDANYYENFYDKDLTELSDFNDVDTVSGATLSSTAVRNGVNAVVRYYNEEISKGGKA